jgi:hypothetical protein
MMVRINSYHKTPPPHLPRAFEVARGRRPGLHVSPESRAVEELDVSTHDSDATLELVRYHLRNPSYAAS